MLPDCHRVVGKIGSTAMGLVPSCSAIRPLTRSDTPNAATARATGGAVRRGRKMSTYKRSPNSAAIIRETTSAGQKLQGPPRSTVVGRPGISTSNWPTRRLAYT